MKRQVHRSLLIAVLAVFALLAAACNAGTDADDIVTILVDERTELDVPAGALPDSMSVDDLRVAPGGTKFDAAEAGPEPLASYRLEPAGLTFAEPLTLRVTLPNEDAPADVITFVAGEGQAGEPVNTEIEREDEPEARNENRGNVTLLTKVETSGHLVHYPAKPFFLDGTVATRVVVGQSFDVPVTVSRNPAVIFVAHYANPEYGYDTTYSMQVVTEDPWSLKGSFHANGPVSPRSYTRDRPARTSVAGGEFAITQSYTCEDVGLVGISYMTDLEYGVQMVVDENLEGTSHNYSPDARTARLSDAWFIDCVALSSQADPSATAGAIQDGSQGADGPTITKSVIVVDGEQYPLDFLNPHGSVNGDCADEHFHTSSPAFPINPDAPPIDDPDPADADSAPSTTSSRRRFERITG